MKLADFSVYLSAISGGQQQAPSVAASVDSSNGDAAASLHLDDLRSEWEALLEQAARCKDSAQQPTMLARYVVQHITCFTRTLVAAIHGRDTAVHSTPVQYVVLFPENNLDFLL